MWNGFSPPWLYGEHLTLIPVNVLSAADTETLIHRVVGNKRLPAKLRQYRRKIFGLTIDPQRLHQIRQERRANSRYAQLDTCKREVAQAEAMLKREGIELLSTTHASIEEISSRVLEHLGINREMY